MKINKRTVIADLCLIALILLVCTVLFAIPKEEGENVELILSGERLGIYSLSENRNIEVRGENGELLNIVCVENGKVYISYANCRGGNCKTHPKIYKEGQCIVCLPNALTVVIRGSGGIDGVTG